MTYRIAILKPAEGHRENWHESAARYRQLLGDAVAFRPWDDPGDLSGFDLVMPLLAWGYQHAAEQWQASLDRWQGLPFANPVDTVRENSNKAYLLSLEAQGIPIVPTRIAAALDRDALAAARAEFGSQELVVKPPVSGGAHGTYRLKPGDPLPADTIGREMLIQPLVPAIAEEGEYSLFHFAGRFSHAILKRPAPGDFRVQEQFGGTEIAIGPPEGAKALARATLDTLPESPLYARIDMVRADDGAFRLMELELIEPALFLSLAPDDGAMFADAVRRHVEMLRTG